MNEGDLIFSNKTLKKLKDVCDTSIDNKGVLEFSYLNHDIRIVNITSQASFARAIDFIVDLTDKKFEDFTDIIDAKTVKPMSSSCSEFMRHINNPSKRPKRPRFTDIAVALLGEESFDTYVPKSSVEERILSLEQEIKKNKTERVLTKKNIYYLSSFAIILLSFGFKLVLWRKFFFQISILYFFETFLLIYLCEKKFNFLKDQTS